MDEYQREPCLIIKKSLTKGVTFLSKTTDTLESLIHLADKAMYESKEQGGNLVSVYKEV